MASRRGTHRGAPSGRPEETRNDRGPGRAGEYDLLHAIDSGGMGTVFAGRGPDGSPVAVKLLKGPFDARSRARFERERSLQKDLGASGGFVPLLDADLESEQPYLVMPLLEEGTLRERLDRGRLSIEETVALGRALAAALGRAHARKIVHRDLKPENILFAKGRPLIADLGLAKRFTGDSDAVTESPQISQTGSMQGTVRYMAPEQAENAKLAGPPADVFSLGAILYECLAGKPAFPGETVVEVLRAIIRGSPAAPLEKLRPDVPPALAAIVARALDRDPAKRFVDGAELARALEGEKVAPPRARLPVRALVLGALAIAALGAGATLGVPALRARARTREAAQLCAQGARAAAEGRLDEARRDLDRALALEPQLEDAWILRAEAALTAKDAAGALADASKALELDPRSARAFLARAEAHGLAREWTQAVDDATAATALDPSLARGYALRADARLRLQQVDQAVADATRAVALDGRIFLAWRARAAARLEKGLAKDAIEDAGRAIALDSASAETWRIRGIARSRSGETDAALDDLSRAIALDPKDAAAWSARAALRERKEDWASLVQDATRALELEPKDVSAWTLRATARWKTGDLDAAIGEASKAIELDPAFVRAWAVRAHARLAKGDDAAAASDYERALSLAPDAPDAASLQDSLATAKKRIEAARHKAEEDHERSERDREREKKAREREREREKKQRERANEDDD